MPDAELEKPGEVVAAAIDSDSELLAIRAVLSALVPLKREARSRVLDYVFKRLGLVTETDLPSLPTSTASLPTTDLDSPAGPPGGAKDIRSLAQQKSPKSANEMAALVAYYLADLAPKAARKDTINSDDLRVYFKQAAFKLPSSARMTLVNAKNAGYLESTETAGQYKLNPVGYNLVVHNLPSRSENKHHRKRTRKIRKAKKKTSSRGH
jgi:hypothetical protein